MQIIIDVAADALDGFLAEVTAAGVVVDEVTPNGPAGGNPVVKLSAHDRAAAMAVVAAYFGE